MNIESCPTLFLCLYVNLDAIGIFADIGQQAIDEKHYSAHLEEFL